MHPEEVGRRRPPEMTRVYAMVGGDQSIEMTRLVTVGASFDERFNRIAMTFEMVELDPMSELRQFLMRLSEGAALELEICIPKKAPMRQLFEFANLWDFDGSPADANKSILTVYRNKT